MDMDAMEKLSDRAMIVKGRRTKRTRHESSPISAVVTSSEDGGGGEEGGGGEINSLIPSVSVCSEISTSTEEDEDMANCLILLAQSGCSSKQDHHQVLQEEKIKTEKNNISSRKFTEMVTTTTTTIAKVGIYVYECKTCNRTFPSFQALGGHRASHKKPKMTTMVEENKKTPLILTPSHDHQDKQQQPEIIANNKSTSHGILANKTKIHECSICGLEFSSGQALGGHMRRHRTTTTTSTSKVTMSIDTSTTESSSHDGERPRNVLQLDLNLPAPEDDHHDSKFQFSSANQQHLFSSPALVDCHY